MSRSCGWTITKWHQFCRWVWVQARNEVEHWGFAVPYFAFIYVQVWVSIDYRLLMLCALNLSLTRFITCWVKSLFTRLHALPNDPWNWRLLSERRREMIFSVCRVHIDTFIQPFIISWILSGITKDIVKSNINNWKLNQSPPTFKSWKVNDLFGILLKNPICFAIVI